MSQSNKGFFLLELLLSLSVLLMLSFFLLPLLTHLRDQSRQLVITETAQQLMFDELHSKLIKNPTYADSTSVINGIQYKITWNNSIEQKEVCVSVDKNSFERQIKVCSKLE